MHVTLQTGTTAFKHCKRGLLISSIGEHTVYLFYVPRVKMLRVNTLGRNTSVWFGSTLKVTMPDDMWADYEGSIIAAAMGEDVVP